MDPIKHLKKYARLRLTDAERASMRSVILERIRRTPVTPRIPSPYQGFFITLAFERTVAFLALIAVAIGGAGGVTFAAENTVPGDVMYAVKVNVSEPLSTLAAVTPAAKAAVATSHAEARLKEAEVLVARGSLDEETAADLSQRFSTSAEEASTHIDGLTDEDPEEATAASAELQSVLAAHGRILDDIVAARDDDTETAVATLRADIAEREAETEQQREDVAVALSDDEGKEASTEVLADVTQDAKTAVEELEAKSADLPADDALALDSRVAAINDAVDQGKAKHELGNYQDALVEFARARTVIGISKRLLEAKERFDEPVTEEDTTTEEAVATDVAAEPEAQEAVTLSAPMAKMATFAATTSATTTATSSDDEVPAWQGWKGKSFSGPHPIHIDLRP